MPNCTAVNQSVNQYAFNPTVLIIAHGYKKFKKHTHAQKIQ